MFKFQLVTATLFLLFFQKAYSRPEYAIKQNLISCQSCHVSPVGGGIRNLNGKYYGTHGFSNQLIKNREWFQLDFRSEVIHAESSRGVRKGMIIMTTAPSINIPVVQQDEENQPSINFVGQYNMGRAGAGLYEAYALLNLAENKNETENEKGFLFGTFLPPFGIQTDEHRTYTRLQTSTGVKDYEAGGLFYYTPSQSIHLDIAFTNGLKDAGSPTLSSQNESPWGTYANVRYIPFNWPIMLGTSNLQLKNKNVNQPASATSLYSILSLDRITNGNINGSFNLEYVSAKGWNNSSINNNISYFVPSTDTSWNDEIRNKQSEGIWAQLNYELSPRFILNLKYESFIPDVEFSSDGFYRNGFGFKWFMNSNTSLTSRYEKSHSTRDGIDAAGLTKASEETVFFLIHLWI
jgi:hypothetical protein